MADGQSHRIDFPEAMEVLLARLGELKTSSGPAAAPGVDRIAETLRAWLTALERGDVPAAVQRISQAMQELAALAAHADPAEAAAMREMVERFRRALSSGALGDAEEAAEVMRARSGSVLHAKKPG
jgi:hypothetical protein